MKESFIPNFLKERLKEQYGENLFDKINEGLHSKRITSFRVNTIKSNNEEIEIELNKYKFEYEKVEFFDNAYVLKSGSERQIQETNFYKEGKIYLQSLSSMLPPIILNPKANNDILDMAAAPGGKTTQMAALSNNLAHITACEMNAIRAERLKYNVDMQGANCVYCMVKDARTIDDFFSFDQILLDAPCSGSGTININDKNSISSFTEKLVNKSVSSQNALLKKAVNILKPGSEMVYSTCSILSCENEDIVSKILKEGKVEIVPIEDKFLKKIPLLPTKLEGTVCIMPNELFEGFFVAKLRKK